MEKKIINTHEAPAPIGPYSQAVQTGSLLFISGQVAINPASGNVEAKDIREETIQVMKNLTAILHEAQMDFNNVIKNDDIPERYVALRNCKRNLCGLFYG